MNRGARMNTRWTFLSAPEVGKIDIAVEELDARLSIVDNDLVLRYGDMVPVVLWSPEEESE